MTLDFALAAAHHLAVLLLVSALGGEAVLLRQPPGAPVLQSLARLDRLYGLAAVLLLLIGGARLGVGAKAWSFYSGNPVFWLKMALFAAVGLLSILPTLRFIRWQRASLAGAALPEAKVWEHTRRLVFVQLHLLPLIAIAAAAMARGIGH